MRILWLENLEQAGHISKEAKAQIYGDCLDIINNADEIEKQAARPPNPFEPPGGFSDEEKARLKEMREKEKGGGGGLPKNTAGIAKKKSILDKVDIPDQMVDALQLWNFAQPFIALGLAGTKGVLHLAEPHRLHGDLHRNRARLDNEPMFNKSERDLAKAHARFNEIASLAPSVAQDYDLTKKLLEKRLHSGLSDADSISLAGLQRSFHNKPTRKQVALRDFLNKKQTFQSQRDLSISLRKKAEALGTISLLGKEAGIFPKSLFTEIGRQASHGGSGKSQAGISAKRLLTQIGLVAGIPAAGGAGLGAFKHHQYKKNQEELQGRLENTFNKIMKEKGDNGDLFRSRPQEAREAFEVMSHFAPLIAVQPTAAKSYVRTLIDGGLMHGATPEVIKTMTEVQKNIAHSQVAPFEEGFVAGAKGMGLSSALSEATKEVGRGMATDIESVVPLA